MAGLGVVGFGRSGLEYLALPFVLPYAVTLPLSVEFLCRITEVGRRHWVAAALPQVSAGGLMYVTLIYLQRFSFPLPALVNFVMLGAIGAVLYLLVLLVISPRALIEVFHMIRRR
jgi:hypothetical protein